MADSDIYQLMLSEESIHRITPLNSIPFDVYDTLNDQRTSCASISSLSNVSDDTIDDRFDEEICASPNYNDNDGGLQRALVLCFQASQISASPFRSKYDDINGDDYAQYIRRRKLKALQCSTAAQRSKLSNTSVSKASWMAAYKQQPHRMAKRSKQQRRHPKYRNSRTANSDSTNMTNTNDMDMAKHESLLLLDRLATSCMDST